ncbi:hypothetical protein QEH52_09595 [Coraliomargarita sp. SDUM461003]|uniref:DUF4424 domain-containing protein n=1 Tax=Thalassobacterium maritimum TaxID=3041265 RepID=A0ABU1AUB1_9BACT|nr:hypothetical protein [Coraliomargarita sp. SDUM461003]MDQ8207763.1 hypothetical protein [Coraliomargarita sp. SDUM461003]
MDTFFRLFLVACCSVVAPWVHGHGAAQTSIRLNVYEAQLEVRIEVTMPDLIKMVGQELSSEMATAPEALRQFAFEYQGEVQKHFKLVDADNRVLLPSSAWAQLPDFDSSAVQNLGLEQQRIEVVLGYLFESPPQSLAVVFDLGQDHHGAPVYADCILRQNDEMTVLPAKVGPGFSIQYAFVWDEPVQGIHAMSNLDAASIGWEYRPVVSYLYDEGSRVKWSVVAPLSAWGEYAYDLSRMPRHVLADTIAAQFQLSAAGVVLPMQDVEAVCFRMNTFDYQRGRSVRGGDPENMMLRLDMTFESPTVEADWLEARCIDFPALSPRMFLSAWVESQGEDFQVLHPEANSFRWQSRASEERLLQVNAR